MTYDRLRQLAEEVISAGYSVVVDATFLERAQRDAFRTLAGELNVDFRIVDVQAPHQLLRERVAQRIGL